MSVATDETDLGGVRVLFVVNVDWFFLSHRLPLALAAKERGAEVFVAAADTGQGVAIEAHGLRFVPLPLSRKGTNPLREVQIFARLIRLYRTLRPDLIHHVSIKPVLYGALAARLFRPAAVVNAISGFGYALGDSSDRRRLRRLVLSAYRLALRRERSRTIIQNVEDLEEFVAAGLVTREKAVLIRGSGADCLEFQPAPEPGGPPVVVMACRLLWEKGVGEFVEAARLLRPAWTEARFVLVGFSDGENPGSVPVETLEQWRDAGVVEWWGRRTDMPAVLQAASLVVLPTFYREGVPKVLIEAAASGRAIVTTDVPGCRDVVRHGVNGVLVAPRDAPGLARAVHSLLDDGQLRHRLGAEGRRLALEEFSIEGVVGQTLEVYAGLLPGRLIGPRCR